MNDELYQDARIRLTNVLYSAAIGAQVVSIEGETMTPCVYVTEEHNGYFVWKDVLVDGSLTTIVAGRDFLKGPMLEKAVIDVLRFRGLMPLREDEDFEAANDQELDEDYTPTNGHRIVKTVRIDADLADLIVDAVHAARKQGRKLTETFIFNAALTKYLEARSLA